MTSSPVPLGNMRSIALLVLGPLRSMTSNWSLTQAGSALTLAKGITHSRKTANFFAFTIITSCFFAECGNYKLWLIILPAKFLLNQSLKGDNLCAFFSQFEPSNGIIFSDTIVSGSRQLALTLMPFGWERGT